MGTALLERIPRARNEQLLVAKLPDTDLGIKPAGAPSFRVKHESLVRDVTDRKLDLSELELLATGRAGLIQREGRTLLIPIAGGGSLGSGAVYAKNLPAPGQYVIDPVQFAVLTSKNYKEYPAQAWPGYGGKINQKIDKVGVVSKVYVRFVGTMTYAVGTATADSGPIAFQPSPPLR